MEKKTVNTLVRGRGLQYRRQSMSYLREEIPVDGTANTRTLKPGTQLLYSHISKESLLGDELRRQS